MKILIISLNIGRTAPGLVFERLIKELSAYHSIDILTHHFSPSKSLPEVNKVVNFEHKELYYRFEEVVMSVFSTNFREVYFARKAANLIDKNSDYDLVFSFVASGQTISLEIGEILQKKLHVRHFTYFVDAIPAPIEWWMGKKYYYRGTLRWVRKRVRSVNGFFAINNQMLAYQLKLINLQKDVIAKVVYVSLKKQSKELEYSKQNLKNIFLYTGSIYGMRSAKSLIAAFDKLLNEFPDALLHFVGKALPLKDIENLDKKVKDRIKLIPFQDDLTPYISEAKVLIDIDAAIENDVFLSSKIITYLPIDKPIITITNPSSPSSELFHGINSILQCRHNSEEILHAMKIAISEFESFDFSDRSKVLEIFDAENIVKELNQYLTLL